MSWGLACALRTQGDKNSGTHSEGFTGAEGLGWGEVPLLAARAGAARLSYRPPTSLTGTGAGRPLRTYSVINIGHAEPSRRVCVHSQIPSHAHSDSTRRWGSAVTHMHACAHWQVRVCPSKAMTKLP